MYKKLGGHLMKNKKILIFLTATNIMFLTLSCPPAKISDGIIIIPLIESTSPEIGESKYPINKIDIVFKEPMDIISVEKNVQFILGIDQEVIFTFNWEQNNKALTLFPGEPLEHNKNYRILIDRAAKTKDGVSFEKDFLLYFNTYKDISDYEFPYTEYKYPYGIKSISNDHHFYNDFLGAPCGEYDLWKEKYVIKDSASGYLRVKIPEEDPPNCTCSYGIGFGMLLAVYMDDPELINGLWNYAKKYFNGNGLMHNVIGSDGNVTVSGSNTYADIDMAAALIFSVKKWGGLYESDALDYINNILHHEIDAVTLTPKASDEWLFKEYPVVVTSVLKPAYMKIFADFTGNDIWRYIADKCYDILQAAANDVTGLFPDWCGIDGTPGGNPHYPSDYNFDQENFNYEASASLYNISLDYFWFGEPRAQAYYEKITNFFDIQRDPQGNLKIWNGYTLDGNEAGWYADCWSTGSAGVAAMAANNLELAEDALEFLKYFKPIYFYEDTSLILSILTITDNYPNLYSYCSYPIPTPAPTPVVECTLRPISTCPPPTPVPPACPVENLVTGGCFDSGDVKDDWTLTTFEADSSFSTVYDKCMNIEIIIPGDEYWNVQVIQWGIHMEKDASYTLSFDAKSNSCTRRITINIGEGVPPYGSYSGEYHVDIECNWQHFEFAFSPDLPDNPNARFEINLGKHEGDVYIDNIVLLQNN